MLKKYKINLHKYITIIKNTMNRSFSHMSFGKSLASQASASQMCGYPKGQGNCVEYNYLVHCRM